MVSILFGTHNTFKQMNCIMKSGKKKMKASQTFKNGTEIINNNDILDLINNRIVQPIEALEQRIYDDETQSLTIRIHYNPEEQT